MEVAFDELLIFKNMLLHGNLLKYFEPGKISNEILSGIV